ncbi:aminotransferase class V-fold PLP-dependent enzyme [Phytohabitans rumicis]|uniref:Putative aminotransferase YcbU n=1 Tax=Phytohabitans rumicis TaxID=1076125 RepID=A0A6V8LEA1_9ACTN|nr:aminotransferase class V-fold PLP-dependent enzyme [Phytohabitans rumicis]GFJ93131.1 putative aminotransferase YcbU [Phytohabitans rumicis]
MNGEVFDPVLFRKHFPGLDNLAYLACCSLPPASARLGEAMAAMLAAMSAPRLAWERFEAEVERLRVQTAALIGARADQVALLPDATTSAFQVASTLRWARQPRLVTSSAEFPGLAHVWLAQRPRGAQVVFVGDRDGTVCAEDYLAAIDARTGLVSVPMTTYRHGIRLPVAQIAAAAHDAGACVVTDAYQATGVEPVDVAALDVDYLITGYGKYLLGLPGIAALYVRQRADGSLWPQLTGWLGRRNPFAFDPHELDFPLDAGRLQLGTPAIPAIYAANAGLSLIGELDLAVVRQHVLSLTEGIVATLTAQGHRSVPQPDPATRGAHVALPHPDPGALSAFLTERNVLISPRGEVARLSVHAFSTRLDVLAACALIEQFDGSARPRRLSAQAGARHA